MEMSSKVASGFGQVALPTGQQKEVRLNRLVGQHFENLDHPRFGPAAVEGAKDVQHSNGALDPGFIGRDGTNHPSVSRNWKMYWPTIDVWTSLLSVPGQRHHLPFFLPELTRSMTP
jgi:hypothetical protein